MKKLFLSVALCVFVSLANARDPDSIRQRLDTEAPQKYDEFLELTKEMRVRTVQKLIDGDTKQVLRESVRVAVFSHGCFLHREQVTMPAEPKIRKLKNGMSLNMAIKPLVLAKNSRYIFSLSQPVGGTDWALKEWWPLEKMDKEKAANMENLPIGFSRIFRVDEILVRDIIRDPTFVFNSAEHLRANKKGLVRVSFGYGGPLSRDKSDTWDGIMVLDPEHFWCVSEYELKVSGSVVKFEFTKAKNEYETDKDGVPLLRRHATVSVGPIYSAEFIEEVKTERHSGIPEREFTMTAFGLPEPMGMPAVDRGGSRWYIWLAVAAMGVSCVGAIIVTLKWRYFQLPASPKPTTRTREGGS